MPDELSAIPLSNVFRAANDLVSAGLIKDYALGDALAAIYYTEPITTYDADIIFVASDKNIERRNSSDPLASPIERLAGRARASVD